MTAPTARRAGQRGQMLALFAIILVGMIWLLALGLDAANLMLRHREMQSIADLSALAGARSLAQGDSDAISRACATAAANGYDCASGEATVQYPYGGDSSKIGVTIAAPAETLILHFFGVATVDVGAPAVALGTFRSSSSYAIFAGCSSSSSGTSCSDSSKAIDWSGSDGTITGDFHSNGGVLVGGSSNSITGSSTASRTFSKGSGNTYSEVPQSNVPREPWPVSYTVADFCPGGSISGNKTFSGTVAPGVYCYSGTINVSSGRVSGNVTFVARYIEISGSDFNFTAHTHNVQFFATGSGDSVIKLSGSNGRWTGLIYAPNGQIEISGQNNVGTQGAGIVGDRIKFNGSDLTVDATGGPGGPTDPAYRLIH